jgi:hypothetical protein
LLLALSHDEDRLCIVQVRMKTSTSTPHRPHLGSRAWHPGRRCLAHCIDGDKTVCRLSLP